MHNNQLKNKNKINKLNVLLNLIKILFEILKNSYET